MKTRHMSPTVKYIALALLTLAILWGLFVLVGGGGGTSSTTTSTVERHSGTP